MAAATPTGVLEYYPDDLISKECPRVLIYPTLSLAIARLVQVIQNAKYHRARGWSKCDFSVLSKVGDETLDQFCRQDNLYQLDANKLQLFVPFDHLISLAVRRDCDTLISVPHVALVRVSEQTFVELPHVFRKNMDRLICCHCGSVFFSQSPASPDAMYYGSVYHSSCYRVRHLDSDLISRVQEKLNLAPIERLMCLQLNSGRYFYQLFFSTSLPTHWQVGDTLCSTCFETTFEKDTVTLSE